MKKLSAITILLLLTGIAIFSFKKETERKLYGEFSLVLGEEQSTLTQCVAEFYVNDDNGDKTSLGTGAQVSLDGIRIGEGARCFFWSS